MSVFTWTNNAVTTLAAGITTTATTLSLTSGSGSLFPSPTTGQYFSLTLQSANNSSIIEIVYCTARSGDALTIIRAQEGTPATAFNAGDNASLLLTAGQLNGLVQIPHMTDATISPVFSNTQVLGTLSTSGAAGIGGQLTVNGNIVANNGNAYIDNALVFSANNCTVYGRDTGGVQRNMLTLDGGNNVDVFTGPAYFRVLRFSDGAGMMTVDNSGNGVLAGGVTANGNVAATGAYLRAGLGARNNPADPNAAAINNDFQVVYSVGNSGYFIMPRSGGEFLIQGGTVTYPTPVQALTENFPIAFPTVCIACLAQTGSATAATGAPSTWGSANAISVSQFQVTLGNLSNSATQVWWIAIGY